MEKTSLSQGTIKSKMCRKPVQKSYRMKKIEDVPDGEPGLSGSLGQKSIGPRLRVQRAQRVEKAP